jgi:demethylmenaquinone methyltransferase/2-methoxy-6-polyprenyl-1,4-benzoquinol methylase
MPFLASFSCLWCGAPHTCRAPDDLEGWAQLCSSCLGKAGDNTFLRFRLHQAITERGRAAGGSGAEVPAAAEVPATAEVAATAHETTPAATPETAPAASVAPSDPEAALIPYYEARAGEYDDWYLRRGRYARGAVHDAVWNTELDMAGRWLDGLPIDGEIVELAAGTGWWSPLLAGKGQLSVYDAAPATLEKARDRLVAHGLRAHLHVRDAWAEPDRPVDAVYTGFWLSHVPRDRLPAFLALVRRWLRPGGRFAFIDSLPDPQSSAADHPTPSDDVSLRRLADGREFTIVKVYYRPDELAAALRDAGFATADVTTSGRFFVLGTATA